MGKQTRTNFGWTVTRRLTNAEILTLFTAPITLLQGKADIVYVPLGFSIVAETTAAAYATAANLFIGVTGGLSIYLTLSLANSGLDANSFTVNWKFGSAEIGFGGLIDPITDVVGLPLILSTNANPTGGDPANYAIVTMEGITLETV